MKENDKELHRDLGVFMAYVLRHKPEAADVTLDSRGWADVGALIDGMNKAGKNIDMATLEEVVSTDGKMRFSFNAEKTKIRANQGHSVPIDLGLEEQTPPNVLYHGTAKRFLDSIKQRGITKKSRNHVHLSKDRETAVNVGERHGDPIVLIVDAGRMFADGHKFYLSDNGVWLTDDIPPEYVGIDE